MEEEELVFAMEKILLCSLIRVIHTTSSLVKTMGFQPSVRWENPHHPQS